MAISAAEHSRRRRERFKGEGLCVRCGGGVSPGRTHCPECTDLRSLWDRERRLRYKREAMEAYGGVCACCGESRLIFLTLDHVNGHGRRYRARGGSSAGGNLYRRLRRDGFPDEGLRVLCFNCNFAVWAGGCPHEDGA